MSCADCTGDDRSYEKFVQFSPERYRRNRMHSGAAYDALVLCWRAGQVSPIHDHRGSACAVRVIRGKATETLYEMTEEGRVFPTHTRQLPEGYMCATQDLDIHRLGNSQPSGDLITLHGMRLETWTDPADLFTVHYFRLK